MASWEQRTPVYLSLIDKTCWVFLGGWLRWSIHTCSSEWLKLMYVHCYIYYITTIVYCSSCFSPDPENGVSFVEETMSLVSVVASGSVIWSCFQRVENHKHGTFYSSAIGFLLFVAVAFAVGLCVSERGLCVFWCF